jgi:citronellol/citronellal dehydrogenase
MFAPGLFDGHTALVTGGGTGIGRATARLLAGLGARVSIASRKLENLESTARELVALAGEAKVHHQTCDIREPEQVTSLVGAVVDKLGPITLLVNNAGGQFPSPAEMISPKGWEAVIRNNLNGTFHVTREVATRCMIPARAGRIVNVTANVYRGFPGMAHTGAARAGVENLTMTLAVEWAPYKISVNAVSPGIIKSSGSERYPPELVEMGRRAIPWKRLGTEEEVALPIVFLLSPGAAYITGAILPIDGGQRLWGDTWRIHEP